MVFVSKLYIRELSKINIHHFSILADVMKSHKIWVALYLLDNQFIKQKNGQHLLLSVVLPFPRIPHWGISRFPGVKSAHRAGLTFATLGNFCNVSVCFLQYYFLMPKLTWDIIYDII